MSITKEPVRTIVTVQSPRPRPDEKSMTALTELIAPLRRKLDAKCRRSDETKWGEITLKKDLELVLIDTNRIDTVVSYRNDRDMIVRRRRHSYRPVAQYGTIQLPAEYTLFVQREGVDSSRIGFMPNLDEMTMRGGGRCFVPANGVGACQMTIMKDMATMKDVFFSVFWYGRGNRI